MPLLIDDVLESYSYRECRCGAVMRPASDTTRRWECDSCGRAVR